MLSNNHISANNFIDNYLENNITYKIDDLYKKIQSITQFYKRLNDEGINTLVKNPKSYECID